jgi:asparagine synthase (glutamine-hydrolysing)
MNLLRPSPASQKLLEMAGLPNWELLNTYPVTREIFIKKELSILLKSVTSVERRLSLNPKHETLSRISVAELSNYLPDILLRDTDQMSMAHALEVRVPFLDYTLIEYVLGLPDEVKYPHTPKKLLTDAIKGLLPQNITHRKKMGFEFPWSSWMKNDLKSFCEEKINSLSEREYFNKNNLQSLWKNFIKGNNQSPYYKLWHLVVLETWIKENNIDA